jgi:hypothetical protein
MSQRAGLEHDCSFEEIVYREIEEVPELLAAHERGFTDPAGHPGRCYASAAGVPLIVARHEKGLPPRNLHDDVDLRDFYYQSYVFRSLYHDQLYRWLRLYPPEQVMIIQSERFFEDSAGTMRAASDFLGLQPFDFSTARRLRRRWDAGASNARQLPEQYTGMSNATRQLLSDFFRPHNARLYDLVGEDFGWQ